jgi:hypothetical protein
MEERKKGFKLSIFLFLAFFIISAFFMAWVYRIYTQTKDRILEENSKTGCISYSFSIQKPVLDTAGKRIRFEIYNKQASIPITKMVLSEGSLNRTLESGVIEPGDVKEIDLGYEVVNGSMWVYPSGCPDLKKELIFT